MSTNLLARIPFFTDLPQDELDRIMSQLEIVNLKSGEILFREGDPGENMYIVVSGDLEILMAPDTDNELILNRVPQGEYIGEMSLVTGAPRTASVRAHGDVVLLSMSRDAGRTRRSGDQTHFADIFTLRHAVEDQFVVGIRGHQDLEVPAHDDIHVLARVALTEQDLPRFQIDNFQLGHDAVQLVFGQVGKKWDAGQQVC